MTFFRLNRNAALFAAILFCCAVNAFAKLSFSSLNLNERDEVLFALSHEVPGSVEYSTIFKTKIKNGAAEYFPKALTCFPERMAAFDGGQKLLVKNRYGSAIYDFAAETLAWNERIHEFPESFAAPLPFAMSGAGTWCCTLERTDMFKGRLVITETATAKRIVLDENCAFSYSSIPVKWSPNGQNFIYEKNGALYLCNPERLFKDVLIEEEFRKVSEGSINSVAWNDNERLTYVSSDLVFQVGTKEIYSFGLYSQFIPLGKILGRLPQKFDGVYDKFWVNSTASDFLIVHQDEMVLWYRRNPAQEGGAFVQSVASIPFVEQGMTPLSFNAFWSGNGSVIFCVKLVRSGSGVESHGIYSIGSDGKMSRVILAQNTHSDIMLSPDKAHFAFLSGENVFVYKISSWKPVCQLKGEKAVSLAWCDNRTLCIGGVRTVKKLSLADFSVKTLFPSSADSAWWVSENSIAVKDGAKNTYLVSEKTGIWSKENQTEQEGAIQNERYRIFCGTTKNSLYENALYVRTLAGKITTRPLVAKSASQVPPRKKVALVFDADENAEGLNSVLAICNEYNLKCTFFFNGEFIRRYPDETKKIAETKHECAAIFFNNINLMDKTIYKDKRFIAKGLARLEDEFFQCTGRELSLYWHAPYNKADKKVRDEGASAGYSYVDFDQPSVISVKTTGGKNLSNSALYEKFDLLLHELFITGAEIVTISDLN